MNRIIISFFIIIFALVFSVELTAAKSTDKTTGSSSAQFTGELNKTRTSFTEEDPYIYVRVLIDGHWWTYVYLDGSFIVAIPDEDE
ncbi:MAG: hypothetical protein HOP31_10820 [Ignavibacteria bacterium]|nr:hypothetical protein [Ignavibacteria bacterium]